jgi:hypothetical protein
MAVREDISVIRDDRPTDQFGDPVGPEPAPQKISGVKIVPRTSAEDADGGVIVIDGLNIFIQPPPRVAIKSNHRIVARGEIWEIEGTPGLYLEKALWIVTRKVGPKP